MNKYAQCLHVYSFSFLSIILRFCDRNFDRLQLFAELEKSSARQRERIEKAREEKRAERKEKQDSYQRGNAGVKRTTVRADSMEELLEKIRGVDWDSVKEEYKPQSGGRFDFTI